MQSPFRHVLSFLLAGCLSGMGCSPSPDQIKKIIAENPGIVFEAIEKDPGKFAEVASKAFQQGKKRRQETEAKRRVEEREKEFSNPRKPNLDAKRAMQGSSRAPITIVEYSDFECPYCSRSYRTVQQVKKKYGDKVRFIYKHLPLDFHPLAMPAARHFEAIALQSATKAYKFHDTVFENQTKLKSDGKKYLETVAKELGVDMAKLKKDLEGKEVKGRIESDMAEAKKFGFSGTPAFLINGVSLKGAYPAPEFEKIIDRLLAAK